MKCNTLTGPGQKIFEGHQGCSGGKAAWEGKTTLSEAVADGTAVVTVSIGGAVTVLWAKAVVVPCNMQMNLRKPEDTIIM